MAEDNGIEQDTYWNSFLPIFFDRMSALMRNNMNKVVEPYGLTSAHSIYLIALKLQDGQTMVNLSRFLDLDPANTNRVIKVLREKGFITDNRKTERSKKYNIFLTEDGKDVASLLMKRIRSFNNNYFAGISTEDIIQLRNTLIAVLRNMDPDLDKYVSCELSDPYYVYLNAIPEDIDFVMVPRRLVVDKYYEIKK